MRIRTVLAAAIAAALIPLGSAAAQDAYDPNRVRDVGEPTVLEYVAKRQIDTRTAGGKFTEIVVNMRLDEQCAESAFVTVTAVQPNGTGFIRFGGDETSALSWTGTGNASNMGLARIRQQDCTITVRSSTPTHILLDIVALNIPGPEFVIGSDT